MLLGAAFFGAVFAGEKLGVHIFDKEQNDLPEIVENRYFRVLTSRNAFGYHIYQGKARGYQYELMKTFTARLNKKYRKKGIKIQFEMIPADYDQIIPLLLEGKGDIIAANLTATADRSKLVAFTEPLRKVRELLITRDEMADKEAFRKRIALRKSSSYYESVRDWNKKHPERFFAVELVDEGLTPEVILELVSKGKYDYALIDSNIFETASKVYPNLSPASVQPFADKETSLAMAVRKGSTELLKELNEFVPSVKEGSRLGNIINAKYFNDAILLRAKEERAGQISPYDEIIQKYAKQYDWDWKLLAALCFQESRFTQDIVNPWGAIGLFQVKQMTADEPYVNISSIKGPKNAENNIHAGVKYLSWIRDNHFPDLEQRRKIRMSLAAYNAGPRTVQRARARAIKMGLDPNVWFRNVELGMAAIRKAEPITYVSEINKRYISYSLLLSED